MRAAAMQIWLGTHNMAAMTSFGYALLPLYTCGRQVMLPFPHSVIESMKKSLSLKCLHDQILDIQFFTFSYTIGLS